MNQYSINQFKSKFSVFIAINLLFVASNLRADEIVPLYVEDGMQVSKVITRNALGGEIVTYTRQKITPDESAPALSEAEQTQPNHTSDNSRLHSIQALNTTKTDDAELSHIVAEVLPPDRTPKQGLVVGTNGDAEKAKVLLEKIKAAEEAKNKTAQQENELKLVPGEELVNDAKAPSAEQPVVPAKKPDVEKKTVRKKPISENAIIDRLEFTQANILDVARALADISGLNFVATEAAAKKNVTVFLQHITVKEALEAITKNTGLWYRKDKDSGTYRIMTPEEYQRDIVVYREDITRVFDLLHPNPINVATAIHDLYGDRVILSYGANYDDFFTGEFNSGSVGGGIGGQSGSNRGSSFGGSRRGGFGQSGLRRGITFGISSRGMGGMGMGMGMFGNNNQKREETEKEAGTAGNMAITEKLTASQLERLESILQVDENGDFIVKDAIRGISGAQQPIYITVSNQQNIMVVRTSDAIAMKEIEKLVTALDKPTQQVLLEMQILEVDVGDAYTQLFSFAALSSDGKSIALSRENGVAAGTGKFVYQFIDDLIGLKLELLKQENKARTVSSPVLLASNNRTARLFVGEERVLIRGATLTDAVAVGQNANIITPQRVTFETEIRNIGTTLNITPKINADGTVTLGIFQDTSSVSDTPTPLPLTDSNGNPIEVDLDTINTANIEGVVVAKDGLTVAIGGLIRTSLSKEENKIPILGDLPIIGNAFKDKIESTVRREMVLLITPHIMKEATVSDDVTRDAVEPLSIQQW